MPDALALLVALVATTGPGLALLTALGVRRPLLLAALAAPASVTVAGAAAVATALTGTAYGLLAVSLLTALLAAVAVTVAVRRREWTGAGAALRAHGPTAALGVVLVGVAASFTVGPWLAGLDGLATPAQEHDTVIHTVLTAYIARTGDAAPWELMPADLITGTPVSFYPSGFHLLTALVAVVVGDVPTGMNAVTVVVLGLQLCAGTAALTAVATRGLGLSARSAAWSGGIAALVVAGVYRPVFHLMHDGGILSNAASLCLTPGVVAGLLCLPGMRRPAAVGVGLAAAGAVWVHPTALVSVGLTAVAWWVGQAVSPWGRRGLRGLPVPLLCAGAAAGLVALAPVLPGLGRTGGTSGYPPDTGPVRFVDAVGRTFGFPYSGWLDPEMSRSQTWVVLLLVVGVAAVVALRRGVGPVAAWAVWSAVVIGAWLSPGTGIEAPVTGFFYHAMLRTWSHVSLLAPVLGGLGVVLVANRLAVLLRQRTPVRARWAAAALSLAAFAGYAAVAAPGYAAVAEESVATRYGTPDFVRVGPDDEAAMAWLAPRVRPGERVFNSPNDGSTYLYVRHGVPVVNTATLGFPEVPYSYQLLESFNTYPTDPQVRQRLDDLAVRWVYVDRQAPGIGSAGSPTGWAGPDGFSQAPGLADLDGLPGLRPVFTSGSVTVYALDLAAVAAPTRS